MASAQAAEEVVGHRVQRWPVEDYFRVLKSGCGVERTAFRTASRMQGTVAIKSVISWRLTVQTRQLSALEAGPLFTVEELDLMAHCAREYRVPLPDRLGAAVRVVAHFAGHLDRKCDPAPGHQTIWKGCGKLATATLGQILREECRPIRQLVDPAEIPLSG